MRYALCLLLFACGSERDPSPPAETPTENPARPSAASAPSAPSEAPQQDPATKANPPQTAIEDPPIDTSPPHVISPARYSPTALHSPITSTVVSNLAAIRARSNKQENVFAKVGDSITVSASNLSCFASLFDLSPRPDLEPTRAFFAAGDAAGTSPFSRKSLAAKIGWSAKGVLPGPLQEELGAISPRLAVVMFGTNDVETHAPITFGTRMITIVDTLIQNGVVPILSSIPPRDDAAALDDEVPRFNAITRGIAEARQIPFMNLHGALLPLANHGLGPDGVHPNTYSVPAGYRACSLTDEGLAFGYNTRNLLTLEALMRTKAALAGTVQDAEPTPLFGDGQHASPFIIETLPFTHASDTRTAGTSHIAAYDGCNASQDESGAEVLYRFDTAKTVRVRAMVIDDANTDIDLHLLESAAEGERCTVRHDNTLSATLAPGTYYFSADTFASHAGEYLFVLLEEP